MSKGYSRNSARTALSRAVLKRGERPLVSTIAVSTILLEVVRNARIAGASAEFLIWTGDPGNSLVAAAEAEHADLLVVGTRGRSGAERMLLGSVSDHLVHHAGCPVLVVRPGKDTD